MAATFNNEVFDSGLDWFDTNGTRLDICSTQPTTYAEATSTYTLGNKTGITISVPTDGDVSGRKITISAITDGSVTGTGTAGFWGITDGTSVFVAAGPLSASQGVTSGNTFTTTAFDVEIPDPA